MDRSLSRNAKPLLARLRSTRVRRFVPGAVQRAARDAVWSYQRRFVLNRGGGGEIDFIDVGSRGGLPPPWMWNARHIRFLLSFEPNDRPVRGASFAVCDDPLWSDEQTRPFYVYGGPDALGSSLFPQNVGWVREHYESIRTRGPEELARTWFERARRLETRELRCRRLDDVLAERFSDRRFHFLKIDAQGAEHPILRGAEKLLSGSCVGLHLELFVMPLYEGISLLEDVERFLAGYGFELAHRMPAHGTFDSQHDCLFLHRDRDPGRRELIRRVYGLA